MILTLLDQKDVFRCRRVNNECRRIVDEFLEDSLVPQHYYDKAYLQKLKKSPSELCPLPKFRIVQNAYKFTSEKTLDQFNEKMAAHVDLKLSPFVGGATVTLVNLFAESYHVSRATKLFLEKFGGHIRRLIIHEGGLGVDLDIIFYASCVKECLSYVPNLEKLKLTGDGRWEKYQMLAFPLQLYRSEKMDQMPKLENLDALEFAYLNSPNDPFPCVPYLEEFFGDTMIKPYYQSQLKKLMLDWPNEDLNFELPNLKELNLTNLQCELSELQIQAPVEKLTLSKPYDEIMLVGIFEKFPQLRYLRVSRVSVVTCLKKSTLSENNVHTLEIMDIDNRNYIPEELQLVFPKLRYLILQNFCRCISTMDSMLNRHYDQEFKNGRVKIAHLICGGTSYDCNLWTSVPKLEIFTLQFQDHDVSKCDCRSKKTGRLGHYCPFKSIVETREGYRRYHERLS